MSWRPAATLATIAVYGALVIALLPILWMVRTSFEEPAGYIVKLPTLLPAAPTLSIHAKGVATRPATTVTRVRFALHGRLTPYVAGQKVVVRLYRGKRKIKVRALTVQPGAARWSGG